jgi:3-dehydroquinate synthase
MLETISCKNYDIHFCDWETLNKMLDKGYSKKIVIVDENTEIHCLPILHQKSKHEFDIIVIPAGEEYKNIVTAQFIWSEMLRIGADRHSICINLGGGVIGDMGGWTAASFMRGMAFIQVPTTLLSMVDASVGGKLGIDFQGVKNIIGLIKDPKAVFIFTEFLETLSTQLIRSGFAEVIKHGLIQDKKYWDKVKTIDLKTFKEWDEIVYESVLIKKAVTEVDPNEKGIRKILNFGHTIGHAVESLSFNHKTPLFHGEAIAIGIIIEAHLSYQQKFITEQELNAVSHFLTSLYGIHPEYIPEASEILPLMLKDKKNKGGRIKFSILNKIGQCLYDQEVSLKQIEEALRYYTLL